MGGVVMLVPTVAMKVLHTVRKVLVILGMQVPVVNVPEVKGLRRNMDVNEQAESWIVGIDLVVRVALVLVGSDVVVPQVPNCVFNGLE
jgi:hypothetical protein